MECKCNKSSVTSNKGNSELIDTLWNVNFLEQMAQKAKIEN